MSAPLHGARGPEGRAIADGARLALADAGAKVGRLRIRAVYLDDTGGGSKWSPVATATNARRAAEDSSTIGYIGELDSGATRFSLPITNQAEIAQISPASTAVDLTREAYGGADPDRYRPSGKQTFARIVPADDVEARAAALLAKRLGANAVAVGSGGGSFGRVLREAFEQQAASLGIEVSGPGGGAFDAHYFTGADNAAPGHPLSATALIRPPRPIIGSDAIAAEARRGCRQFDAPVYITSPFRRERLSGEPPATAYGYEAMSLLLDAIRRAGDSGDDRDSVIDEILATRDRRSVIGEYSIDGEGETTLDRVAIYELRDCRFSFDRELHIPNAR